MTNASVFFGMTIENQRAAWILEWAQPRRQRRAKWFRAALMTFALSSQTAATQGPDDGFITLLKSAEQNMDASRYPASQGELEAAIKLAPRRPEAWTELGLLYDRVNDFKNAEASLRYSLQLDPGQARAHYLLGLTLIANPTEKLDWPAAIQEFRDAIRLDPNDADAMDHLGVGLEAIDHTDEAVAVLERAVALAPGRASSLFDLGLALESKGDLAGAATNYRLALNAKRDYGEAASALGKLLFAQDHLQEAEKTLIEALRSNPDLQDAHYALGRVLRKEKKTEQAQHEFEEAVALGQRVQQRIDSSQLSNGALAKAAQGDFVGAEEDLRKAIRLRPDYGVPHYNLGLILADRQKMTEAAQQLRLAISLLPGRPQPWIDLAKVQAVLGDPADAQQTIDQALQLAPDNVSAQREAQALQVAKSTGSALADRSKAATLVDPSLSVDTVASHTELASSLEARADWVDAAGEWLRVLALEPGADVARVELADCFQHLGDSKDSILEARKILLLNPENVRAHISLGNALVAAGSPEEASMEFKQALLLDPNSKAAKASLNSLHRP